MSTDHKALLRRAAEEMDTIKGNGMCYALLLAHDLSRYGSPANRVLLECKVFLDSLYFLDSPYRKRVFWMGPDFTEEQQQHRIMALLFAAEAYDDMEGV